MAVSVYKTFVAGEVLTASDLNLSLTQITSNGEDLGWPATKEKDLDGQALILDSDADTTLTADTDDQVDFAIGGTDIVRFKTVASAVNGFDFIGSATGNGVDITAQGSDTNIDINLNPKGSGVVNITGLTADLNGAALTLDADADTTMTADTDDQVDFSLGGTDIVRFKTVASAVNGFDLIGSATGNSVDITAQGTDTDIGIDVNPKGSGTVLLNGPVDINGNVLTLDADADTTITADTDDQIDIALGGTDLVVMKTVSSAAVRLEMTAAVASGNFTLASLGSTNCGINIDPNGTGSVQVNSSGATTSGKFNVGANGLCIAVNRTASTGKILAFEQAGTERGAIYAESNRIRIMGVQDGNGVQIGDGVWNSDPMRLGNYYFWVDSADDLRMKNGTPTSDSDGQKVGTQS